MSILVTLFETVESSINFFLTTGPSNYNLSTNTTHHHQGDSINFTDPLFMASIFFAFFNPMAWNLGGRVEYHTQFLTKICGGKKFLACYIFAFYIFSIGIIRDIVYKTAISRQPSSSLMMSLPFIDPIAFLFLFIGSILVLSSMYKLGITGTYLGDHFGILKDSRITSFPFNVVEHPMYYGSTLCFFSIALRMKSPAGLFITALIALAYVIASEYEGKFTARIYSKGSISSKKKL